MAHTVLDNFLTHAPTPENTENSPQIITLQNDGQSVELPDASYVRDATITRDGVDLVLETTDGTIVIEGYYTAEPTPNLVAPDGITLTPDLVQSFTHGGNQYADAGMGMSDVSPIGAVQEISGEATVTRLNGSVEVIGIGTPIYQGDVIDTDENGAVNIMFVDDTTFAVSEDARLSIDEYVFDPTTQSGISNFSVLKGVFVFTSGLIGRDDPDDVMINTPSGSIGIRGTIIAGDVTTGEITVIEGAIVLYDLSGNTMTLANQYETARFNTLEGTIEHIGELSANEITSKFMSVSTVAADLFSSIQDSAAETGQDNKNSTTQETTQNPEQNTETQDAQTQESNDQPSTEDTSESTPENNQENIQDTAPEDNQEQTSLEAVITSEDIVQSGANNDTQSGTSQTGQNDTQSSTPESTTTSTNTQPQIITPEPDLFNPFQVQITKLSFAENVTGANVMVVTGNFTNMTNLSLTGISQNYFDAIRQSDNNFLIKLKAGVSLDAEDLNRITFEATNDLGTSSISRSVDLDILDINEPTTFSALMPNISGLDNFFSGSQDSNFSYNFSNDFDDPDDNITGYNLLSAPVSADISIYNLNSSTGLMTIDLDASITGDSNFTFTVEAISSSGNISNTYTFDIFGATTSTTTLFAANNVYSGTDSSIFIAANNVSVFSDGDSAMNNITISGNNSYVKAGDGNDTITINGGSTGYHLYGDAGNDTFDISQALGKSYGGGGNDTFILQNTGVVSDFESLTNGLKIDGGAGLDLVQLSSTAGNINFGNINAGLINNIEAISTNNGATNVINLSYNSVISMTDDDNKLIIEMDSNDTLNFTNGSGNDFVYRGQDMSGDYDVYTDGTITLLVDTDNANVNGII